MTTNEHEDSDYHRQQMLDREKFIFQSQREGYSVTVLDNGNVVAQRSPGGGNRKPKRQP
jgi:hypothetical protein